MSKVGKVFWKIWAAVEQKPRYISSRGGTRSGKTYATLQVLSTMVSKFDTVGDITSVVSETLPHLKRGAIRDFERILGHPLKNDTAWSASSCTYTFPSGGKIEFFSADAPGKVLGPARKRLFVNECNHISHETFRQLAVRTTGIIFLDYNPASLFWANTKVETRPNCVTIVTTYLDNDFLSPEQVAEIESNKTDANWWRVYGEGKIGQLDGVVYTFDQIDSMPTGVEASSLKECYGLDFGFTNDPTACVHILADTGRKVIYCEEVIYKTRMTNADISRRLRDLALPKSVEVFADCAEPKSIEEIRREGINIRACDKDAPVKSDKLKFQLQWMQGWKIMVTKSSLNLIEELRNYTWAKDSAGNPTNSPIDKWNHALDALRYGCWSKFGRANSGNYTLSIR